MFCITVFPGIFLKCSSQKSHCLCKGCHPLSKISENHNLMFLNTYWKTERDLSPRWYLIINLTKTFYSNPFRSRDGLWTRQMFLSRSFLALLSFIEEDKLLKHLSICCQIKINKLYYTVGPKNVENRAKKGSCKKNGPLMQT